jgi:mRNA-degrading endonuclease RelE of RelBE toxin-antitoxin system
MKQDVNIISVSKKEVFSATLEVVSNHYQKSLNNFFTHYDIIPSVDDYLYNKALKLFPDLQDIPRNHVRIEQQKGHSIFTGAMPKLIYEIMKETNRISVFKINHYGNLYDKQTIHRDYLDLYVN